MMVLTPTKVAAMAVLALFAMTGLLAYACESERQRFLENEKERAQAECKALVKDAEREARYSETLGCMVMTEAGWIPFNRYNWPKQ